MTGYSDVTLLGYDWRPLVSLARTPSPDQTDLDTEKREDCANQEATCTMKRFPSFPVTGLIACMTGA
eukprot:1149315-Pelagomonas_calceolata.AAC.4